MTEEEKTLRITAWENVIHSYGTYAVFRERIRKLERVRSLRDFFGIALPLILGFSLGNPLPYVQIYLNLALGIFALAQLLVVVWSLVTRWDDKYFYAMYASRENEGMFQEWESTAKSGAGLLQANVDYAQRRDRFIQDRDQAQGITDREKRFGMRSALLNRRKACAVCLLVPEDMSPTKCSVCGNF